MDDFPPRMIRKSVQRFSEKDHAQTRQEIARLAQVVLLQMSVKRGAAESNATMFYFCSSSSFSEPGTI